MGLVFALVVWWTRYTVLADGTYPVYLYLAIIFVYALHQVSLVSMISLLGLQRNNIPKYENKYRYSKTSTN